MTRRSGDGRPGRAAALLLSALAAGSVGAPAAAPAQEPAAIEEARAGRARGLAVVTLRGRAPAAGASGATYARLRRGARTALATAVPVGADGRFEVELLTPRLLLPGRYEVELAAAPEGPALARAALKVGDDAAAAAADARLDRWYRDAARTLRELAGGLERRGRYHHALIRAAGPGSDDAARHRTRFGVFLDGWTVSLVTARMDLATFARRLVLPPRPDALAGLERAVAALEARAEAWQRALADPRATTTPDPADEVEAAAAALVAAFGLAGGVDAWRGGPLATPPPGDPPGTAVLADAPALEGGFRRARDPLGFGLDVPPGFEARPADQKPFERAVLKGPDAVLVLQVAELPDAQDPDALVSALEVAAWEGWLSYKRLAATRGDGWHRLELEALSQNPEDPDDQRTYRIVARSTWPPAGGRAVTLLVVLTPGAPPPSWLARVEESLTWP